MEENILGSTDYTRNETDPTSLTTSQILREVGGLKELVLGRIESIENAIKVAHDDLTRVPTEVQKQVGNLKELHEGLIRNSEQSIALIRTVIETRLDGMDKAIELLQSTADKFPARMDEKITSLKSVHEEKFESIEKQFKERDTRIEQTSKDSKTAVDAALQAAEKAVAKSETSTLKQIDQQGELIRSNTKNYDDKLGDVKDRVTKVESVATGKKDMWGYVIGAIGVLATVITIVAMIIKFGK